jgi:hypothetical protein
VSVPVDPRGHRELVHSGDVEPEPVPASGWPGDARVRVLSRNPETGAFSGLLRLPRGAQLPAFHLGADTEWLVLSGWMRVGDDLRTFGWYEWAPARTSVDPWHVLDDVEILFMPRSGAPDLTEGAGPRGDEGRIRLDSETLPWGASMTKNAPKYSSSRLLRFVPETGERSSLLTAPPNNEHPKIEFHDSVEEMYKVVGDTWLENSGLMETGSYFWRPPYITHGPFRSTKGGISYLYVDKMLINFFVDDPASTPEANFVEAERQRREGIV